MKLKVMYKKGNKYKSIIIDVVRPQSCLIGVTSSEQCQIDLWELAKKHLLDVFGDKENISITSMQVMKW